MILKVSCMSSTQKAALSKLLPKDIRSLDPSLQYDFPELCLFHNAYTFCDHIKRSKFVETEGCFHNVCAAKL